jgi:DNA-binding IclR family transcriptional regulator
LKEYLQAVELTPFTPNTVVSKDKLKKELMQIKENGYSIDDEELSVGLRCVGAPLFNHSGQALYAISLSGPSIRMGSKRIEEMQRALKKICQNLSGKMGDYYF